MSSANRHRWIADSLFQTKATTNVTAVMPGSFPFAGELSFIFTCLCSVVELGKTERIVVRRYDWNTELSHGGLLHM